MTFLLNILSWVNTNSTWKRALMVLLLFFGLVRYTAEVNWKDGQWEHVIEADGRGYWGYLLATFIYDDLNFGFWEESEIHKSYDPNLATDYRVNYEGHTINKFFAGTPLCLTPFFMAGHVQTKWNNGSADGYSRYYIVWLTIGACFYACLGLFFLIGFIRTFNISEWNAWVGSWSILLGTNLFYYTIGEPGLSHVYSFGLVAGFLFFTRNYFLSQKQSRLVIAALLLGLIVFVRPVNGLVVFSIPFVAGSKAILLNGLKALVKKPMVLLLLLGIVLTIPALQLVIYKLQTGNFLVYSYMEEGFNFSSPQILPFLISYKKGWFVYTPLGLVALFGFLRLVNNKYIALTLGCFLALVIYVLASWWNWYYGGSFSSRVMVEYLPYFGLLLAFLLQWASARWKTITVYVAISACLLLNQIQTLQYRHYLIHWSEMDQDKYWEVFLDLKPVIENRGWRGFLF